MPVATEPEDVDPPSAPAESYSAETLRNYLPEWALAPVPERVEGPLVQVRRVVECAIPPTISTLRKGFDETKGTIEIADEGPFLINDCRVAGESAPDPCSARFSFHHQDRASHAWSRA